jgi:CBS-domain-containing membrane protein
MSSLVRDMMTTEVVTVEASTPVKEIVARLAGRRLSAAPTC